MERFETLKNTPHKAYKSLFIKNLQFQGRFFLETGRVFVYNKLQHEAVGFGIGGYEKLFVRGDTTMKKYYYRWWVPFTMNKKRILVLTIASYIAMC